MFKKLNCLIVLSFELKKMVKLKDFKEHLLEFFLVGVLFGVIEDILAIMLYGGNLVFNWKMVYVASVVAVPLAIFSELIVDRSKIFRLKNNKRRPK